MTRVLFLSGEYPAMQGGVGDYTRLTARALVALGAEVHVLTHSRAGQGAAGAGEPVVHPVLQGYGWGLWREVQDLLEAVKPDVLHIQYQAAAYGLHPAVNLLPWRLRLRRGRPRVAVTFHDLCVPYLFPKAGPLRRQTVLALARGCDASVVTNAADWQQLHDSLPHARIAGIPIGSNIDPVRPPNYDRQAQRERWGVAAGDWLLAYFGFLNAQKGGQTLVDALKELVRSGAPVQLLMIGGQVGASDPTNAAYLSGVKARIQTLGLAERVHWTGFTPEGEVTANLLAADVAVLPFREGASARHGSLMAALAHGLPIVSTQLPDSSGEAAESHFPAVQDGTAALLVPRDDAHATAAAVRRVMQDEALRAHLSEGAVALARQFRWEAIAASHLELYRRLGK